MRVKGSFIKYVRADEKVHYMAESKGVICFIAKSKRTIYYVGGNKGVFFT